MTTLAHSFDDALGYEQFMGRWSRPLSQEFLRWLSVPAKMKWLDVGCGTGIFTKTVLDTCCPTTVVGVDCARAQIDHARQSVDDRRAKFHVADARKLPASDASFDVVASVLAINFVPDRSRALAEMRRVVRPNGLIGGCVWDFSAELSPSWPIRVGMSRVGVAAPPIIGTEVSSLDALVSLYKQAGLRDVEAISIEVTTSFESFDELWHTLTPGYAPLTKAIAQMSENTQARLLDIVRAELPPTAGGNIAYSARANAVRVLSPLDS